MLLCAFCAASSPRVSSSLPVVLAIFLNILAPILSIVVAGAVLRWRFRLGLGTLSTLNIYVFAPGFVFDKVANSTLSWAAMGGVVLISVVQCATLGGLVW